MDRHAKPRKRSWRDDERRIERWILPAFGRKRLKDVKRADVARLCGRIGAEAPFEANRVLALLGVIFAKAEEWGFVPDGHPNPARKVKRFQEHSRDRWLRPEEVDRLLRAAAEDEDLYARAAVALYLLTGLRKRELLSLRWEDIDLERAELRVPETKSGRPHVLPLSPAALAILDAIPPQVGSPWVFPGPKGPCRDIKGAWGRIRRRAGLEDVRLHDLRRTVGSWMAQAGVPLQVIGEVLNHTHPQVTRVYARLADESRRAALNAFADRLLQDAPAIQAFMEGNALEVPPGEDE